MKSLKKRVKELPLVIDQANYGYDLKTIINIEEAILGVVLLERDALDELIGLLKPDSFSSSSSRKVWEAIMGLYAAGNSIDVYTVAAHMKKRGDFEVVGGAVYLARLTANIASSANLNDHVKLVLEASTKRFVKQNCLDIIRDIESSHDAFKVLDKYDAALRDLNTRLVAHKSTDQEEVLNLFLKNINNENRSGLRTGLPQLDTLFDKAGWRPGELSVIAARPGAGKTALMVNFALEALKDPQEGAVLFCSLEMNSQALISRMASRESGITLSKIKAKELSKDDKNRIYESVDWIYNCRLLFAESSSMTPFDIFAKAKAVKREYGLKVLFVDYLQIVSVSDQGHYRPDQQVAFVAKRLKEIANELNIPVIAGSQVNRQHEQRGGGRYKLSDLSGSDIIGHGADNVFFILPATADSNLPEGYVDLDLHKHRNGDTGVIGLKFDKKIQKFSEVSIEEF